MPENEMPPPPPDSQPAADAPTYNEFGTAKRSLPPVAPVAIALVVVAIVIGIVAYTQRAKPVARGSIDEVWFSQPSNMPDPMILIAVTLRNVGEKPLYIKSIKAALRTDEAEHSDDAASASDYERYFQAYPDLQGHGSPLQVETKIPPGTEQKGLIMVSFPVPSEVYERRQDIIVTIQPYDQNPIVIHEKKFEK
jgi:hypothetical protein